MKSQTELHCASSAIKKQILSEAAELLHQENQFENSGFHRRRIFSLSLGDWLDPEVPVSWLARMLDTIRKCDQVDWLLCTKRPELFFKRIGEASSMAFDNEDLDLSLWLDNWTEFNQAPTNIVILASVENQEMADKRIPELLRIPAACRGLSLEPLLGPVELDFDSFTGCADDASPLNWLIIGGESGPNARPCNPEWIRSLIAQGKAAGVATFCKQLGSYPLSDWNAVFNHHDWSSVRDRKGGDKNEWPAELRVQEWPKGF